MEQKEVVSEITQRVTTVDQLLEIHNLNLQDWEVERQSVNTWEVGAKGPDGTIVTTPLYQVKVTLKSKKYQTDIIQIIESAKEDLKRLSPKVVSYKYVGNKGDGCLLQINIFDVHLGKIAWNEEVNDIYDTNVAIMRYNNAIDYFIQETQHKNIERICLPIGNDFFNSDKAYPFNSTTSGTPQDEDGRWQDTFRRGREMLVENITKLSQIAPVDVIVVPGNHDFQKCFYLGDALEGWFYRNDNVTVNNSANPRKYYVYHKNLIGLTHGNEERLTDLPMIMANEQPVAWSQTWYREWNLGHLHHKKEYKYKSTEDYQGVMIRYMSSLSGTDAWHHKKGYVGATRSAEALIRHPEKGMIQQIYYNI